jgi:osmotically-inducible protein OsmY
MDLFVAASFCGATPAHMNQHTETRLQRSVLDELRCDPRLDAGKIEVSVDGAAVTLAGSVPTYSEKCHAEALARRVRGVGDVQNALDVRLTIGDYRTDATLLRLATDILESLPAMFPERPKVTVREGWLTLDGIVESAAQKQITEDAFLRIAGIRGVSNRIRVVPRVKNVEAKRAFEEAVRRCAALNVANLGAEISGRTIVVRGTVGSCVEHDMLIEIASCAPGITTVDDHVVVCPEAHNPGDRR